MRNRSLALGLVSATAALAVTIPGAGVAAAPTATTIGSLPPTLNVTCLGGATLVQTGTAAGTTPYSVPFDGVITSYSVKANANAGYQARMLLFSPPTSGTFPLRAKTPFRALIASADNTYDVRVPVRAGWLLGGSFSGSSAGCGGIGATGDHMALLSGDPDTATSLTGSDLGAYRVDISAVVEPDADHDGFGDITQDACPQSALAQGTCSTPQTTITKKPKAKSHKRQVTVAFASSAARSTFLVTVDGKRAKETLSPFRVKLKPGKHTVTVQAVSPLGVLDPTPASVRFKILKPKKH